METTVLPLEDSKEEEDVLDGEKRVEELNPDDDVEFSDDVGKDSTG